MNLSLGDGVWLLRSCWVWGARVLTGTWWCKTGTLWFVPVHLCDENSGPPPTPSKKWPFCSIFQTEKQELGEYRSLFQVPQPVSGSSEQTWLSGAIVGEWRRGPGVVVPRPWPHRQLTPHHQGLTRLPLLPGVTAAPVATRHPRVCSR